MNNGKRSYDATYWILAIKEGAKGRVCNVHKIVEYGKRYSDEDGKKGRVRMK